MSLKSERSTIKRRCCGFSPLWPLLWLFLGFNETMRNSTERSRSGDDPAGIDTMERTGTDDPAERSRTPAMAHWQLWLKERSLRFSTQQEPWVSEHRSIAWLLLEVGTCLRSKLACFQSSDEAPDGVNEISEEGR